MGTVRPVDFFSRNAQTFVERWARRGGLGLHVLLRPFLYAASRAFATRVLHTLLRGVSRDRLDLLGEEYFQYVLKDRLQRRGVEELKRTMAANGPVVLVSQSLDHVLRPLANHLGVEQVLANRLEFRDGLATGRLLDPVIPPRGLLARLTGRSADGRVPSERLCREWKIAAEVLRSTSSSSTSSSDLACASRRPAKSLTRPEDLGNAARQRDAEK